MKEWRTIKREIHEALSDYDHSVYFQRPLSDGQCGYFSISINEDYDWEDIESALSDVVDDWDLEFDWDGSDEDVDLNALWDVQD